jgi:hypothetical protein
MWAISCNAMLTRLLAQGIEVCHVAAHAQCTAGPTASIPEKICCSVSVQASCGKTLLFGFDNMLSEHACALELLQIKEFDQDGPCAPRADV